MSDRWIDGIAKRFLENKGITRREWKQQKRWELKEVIAAFDTYRLGCRWTPNYPSDVKKIEYALKSIKKSHSQKERGR